MDSTLTRNGIRQSGTDGLEFGMTYFNQESKIQEPKGRRLSKSMSRSRSDTTTSTSSIESPPSSTSSPKHMSRHNSFRYEDADGTNFQQRFESRGSRSFFAKGSRVLKRQGSKFSLLTVTEDSSEDPVKYSLTRPDTFRIRSKSASRQNPALRKPISHPFDFQHLVHTDRQVLQKLEQAEREQRETSPESPPLFIENQSPPSPSEHFAIAEHGFFPTSPPPRPPPRSLNRPRTASNAESISGFRASRSIENFSRPAQRLTLVQSPPPNRLSFHDPSLITEITERSILDLDPSSNGDNNDLKPILSPTLPMPVGNAVTTYDDSARVIKSKPLPPLQKPLPQLRDAELPPLPEETESIGSRTPTPDGAPSATTRSSLRHSRSSPGLLMSIDQSSFLHESPPPPPPPPPTDQRVTLLTEEPLPTIGSPLIDGSRFSIGVFKSINVESWEEDIDYCYEHAAEADCDFEWARRSEEFSRSLETVTEMHSATACRPPIDCAMAERGPEFDSQTRQLRGRKSSKPLTLSGLATRTDDRLHPLADLPDLDTRSADSSSTYKGALTPGFSHDKLGSSSLPMASPIEKSHQPKIYTQEQLGDEVVDLYGGLLSESHDHDGTTFEMYSDLAPTLPNFSFDSDRRSQSSIGGKYNFYRDSFCLPQGLSTMKGSYHRSVNSESSVPGLDHSQTSSREFNPEMGLPSSARHSIISLTHCPSTSKLSYMSTPSLTSGGTISTPGTSLREQISVEEMQIHDKLTMETTSTSQSTNPGEANMNNTARSSRPNSPSETVPPPPTTTTGPIPIPGHHAGRPSLPELGASTTIPSFAARMRSGSTAAPSSPPPSSKSNPRRTSSRVSYSLFPSGTAAALKSPTSPPPVSPPVGNFF